MDCVCCHVTHKLHVFETGINFQYALITSADDNWTFGAKILSLVFTVIYLNGFYCFYTLKHSIENYSRQQLEFLLQDIIFGLSIIFK